MKPEDFEKRLQEMPQRELPSEWRAEILAAARQTQRGQPANASAVQRLATLLSEFLSRPRGLAWSGVAALWIVILTLNLTGPETSNPPLAQVLPSARAMQALQREKQFLLAELNGASAPVPAPPPKPNPTGPRSNRTVPTATI